MNAACGWTAWIVIHAQKMQYACIDAIQGDWDDECWLGKVD